MGIGHHPTRAISRIQVGTQLSGEETGFAVHRLVGTQPGPSLGLVGGVHGDEPLSVELVRRVLEDLEALPLRGSVTAVPCANPLALQSLVRNTPADMLDLNRVFPGDPNGPFTQQLAFAIQGVFRNTCEYLLDFHSGGLFPTVDYVFIQADEALARSVGSKVLYAGSPHVGSVSDCLRQAGLRTVVVETGGGPAGGETYIRRALVGVRNVLRTIGMLDGDPEIRRDQILVSDLRIVRPHQGGLLLSSVNANDLGETVTGPHELGRVLHTQTFQELEVLLTPFEKSVFILVHEGCSPVDIGGIAYIVGDASGGQ